MAVVVAALTMALAGVVHAPAQAAAGPALETPKSTLDRALSCNTNLAKAKKDPVLLVHGTGGTPSENFDWNLGVILPEQGYPICEVTIPAGGMGDLQGNVEYVVRAIRRMAATSGRQVSAIGHSQGAFLISYALRIWPDLAAKVDDVIGYAGTYTYGTDAAKGFCLMPCSEAFMQFVPGSHLLSALAKYPLPAGPSYTAYTSRYDELVLPQPKAGTLVAPGARNYVVQDMCPLDTAEHLLIIGEEPTVELTLDALGHPGPASLTRIGKVTCGFNKVAARLGAPLGRFAVGVAPKYVSRLTSTEPPLRAYFGQR